jgi:hypothetical protein
MKQITVTFTIPDDWDTESFAIELLDAWCEAHESEWDTDEDGETVCPIVLQTWRDK